jgi:uncharacterized protein
MNMTLRDPHIAAAAIVEAAGGELVGRTRLQKIGYLLELVGLGAGFEFEYHHYGPYSEELATGIDIAAAFDKVKEDVRPATWGGAYSVFRTLGKATESNEARLAFVSKAKEIDSIELELAATAAFLFAEEGVGHENQLNPWAETRKRKPTKAADGRLEKAANAYALLREAVETPKKLPDLARFTAKPLEALTPR